MRLKKSRDVDGNSEIGIGHISRIDHVNQHEHFLFGCVDEDVAGLVIDTLVVKDERLVANGRSIAPGESRYPCRTSSWCPTSWRVRILSSSWRNVSRGTTRGCCHYGCSSPRFAS